jgi:DNA-binding NarL/FixJ family response regulator
MISAGVEPIIILASKNRFTLSLLYTSSIRKKQIHGCFTTGQGALEWLKSNRAGILITTIDLEDGDNSGDDLVHRARLLQPSLRCVLIVDHDHYHPESASTWRSPVIVAAKDIGDETQAWNMALLAAIGDATYRSKSVPPPESNGDNPATVKLTPREKQMLQCFALGLTNAEAAERLNLSPQSTKTYSRNLLAKLNVGNRQLALLKALGKVTAPSASLSP